MADKKAPNPDKPWETAASPDDMGWNNEATIGAIGKVGQLEHELNKERALKETLKAKYGLEDTDLELSQEFLEAEADAVREYLWTDEGYDRLKHDIARNLAAGEPEKSGEEQVLDAHTKAYRDRMAREQAMFDEKDEE